MSKAQASIPLILAIVLILALIFLILPENRSRTSQLQDNPASMFITSCLHQAGVDAIRHVAANGASSDTREAEIAISRQTEQLLPRCYDNFAALNSQGIEVRSEQPLAMTTITDNSVAITLQQKTTATLHGRTRKIENFATELSVPLKDTLTAARILQQEHEEGSDITWLIKNNINATFLTDSGKRSAIIEFPINGRPEPGRWWVGLP